ncbi:PH domain-containing protein [Permianibacter sp. IMCC34836]|uniref:PH domain-containing protein n=1 Tax=Permianibacter fluminis TaxID=2738515 RepID=UPI0015566DE2|nr:PH domain-containing protein [Permianibacter fluminis]NQD37128.1 PH domain-containing protein [Permianibacter fluminis]
MDSYVKKVLISGERILHTGQVSWWTLLGPLALSAMLLASALSLQLLHPIPVLPLVLLAASALVALVAYVRQRSTELAITNKRIIVKRGFVRRDTIEINLVKVESLQVEQNLLGRMLNFGDIIVSAGGGPMAPVSGIAAPLVFRQHFNEATDQSQQPAKAG